MKYTYFCKKCNKEIEVEHSMKETPEIFCDTCNELMKIKIEGGGVIFKANGFYSKKSLK